MSISLKAILREPLMHFILVGGLLFVINDFSGSDAQGVNDASEGGVIVVNRDVLLAFMQYRAEAFDEELFTTRFDQLSAGEYESLVNDYVKEEALYREAKSMGLDNGDYNIRQRLVEKLDFLLEDSMQQSVNASAQALENYYQLHSETYTIDSVYTFSHIYFSNEQNGADEALAMASDLLPRINQQEAVFNDAGRYGDRYPFFRNYVERSRDYVRSNFDDDFVDTLDQINANSEQWQGPYNSLYGAHLVLLSEKQAPRLPALSEIQTRVTEDYRFEQIVKGRDEAEAVIISRYQIEYSE